MKKDFEVKKKWPPKGLNNMEKEGFIIRPPTKSKYHDEDI